MKSQVTLGAHIFHRMHLTLEAMLSWIFLKCGVIYRFKNARFSLVRIRVIHKELDSQNFKKVDWVRVAVPKLLTLLITLILNLEFAIRKNIC